MKETTPAQEPPAGENDRRSECGHCGTCCRKGGPALHREDLRLVTKGILPLRLLYTIREGEPAFDNILNRLAPAETDIIKLRGKGGGAACFLFSPQGNNCTIYADRPLECRILKCWDTGDIEAAYARDRLTRQDLVAGMKGVWKLVAAHQAQCSYARMREISESAESLGKEVLREKASEIFAYDAQLRKLAAEKGGIDPDILEFLFGRPMPEVIGRFKAFFDRHPEMFE